MHVLIPFDIAPVSERVPFGVAPVSERTVRAAVEVFGAHDESRITAVHFTAEDDHLRNEIAASEIESLAEEHGCSVDVAIRTLEDADSMRSIRRGILAIVDEEDVDFVVMGYEEKTFVEEMFHESTANRVLETHDVPVALIP